MQHQMRVCHAVTGLLILGLTLKILVSGFDLPKLKPAGVSSDQFSAERAVHLINRLLGDGSPHPVGSDANERVRDRILAEFRSWGYNPEVQTRWGATSRISRVENIVARLAGKQADSVILLTAHYDSVGASPGAADDGVGMAIVLEIARMLKAEAQPENSIVFLISDGEESFGLGASAFAREHPWGGEYKAVVVLDGADATGPFWIWETGYQNTWLAPVAARSVPHPLVFPGTNLPRGSRYGGNDFSVYRDQGWQGFLLLQLSSRRYSHTALDTVSNIDLRTVQHGGESALPLVRALAQEDLRHPSSGRAVMMDLFGRWLLWWPIAWNYAILSAAGVLLIAAVLLLARSGQLDGKGVVRCAVAWIATLIVAVSLGAALRSTEVQLEPTGLLAVWCAVALLSSACYLWITRRAGSWDMWVVTMSALLVLGAAVLFAVSPTLGYVPALPLLVGVIGVMLARGRLRNSWAIFVAAVPPAIVALVLLANILKDALIQPSSVAFGGVNLFLIAGPILPLAAGIRRRVLFSLAACASVLMAMALLAGRDRSGERLCSLAFFQDANTGTAEWLAGLQNPLLDRLPDILMPASLGTVRSNPRPWSSPLFVAPAASIPLQPPELRILDATRDAKSWTVRTHVQSKRRAAGIKIMFPPEAHLESVEAMGQVIMPPFAEHGWRIAHVQNVPPEGFEWRFRLAPEGPVDVDVLDYSFGLPESGRVLQINRSRFAVPYLDGDVTIVWRTVRLHQER